MLDLIEKKKLGQELNHNEINFIISGYTKKEIPDYQMSAFLMAVRFMGMTAEETSSLTVAMVNSGEIVDLSSISGIKVDKHSTGGVGDKTTLIISPIVASLGVPIAKMSGRGLSHTGGTVDKLEAIPNLRTEFSKEEFLEIVKTTGICVAGQSGNLAPADKKIYALRDVTGTVDSIPLIAASIMSKKIAAGSDAILLDVKTGSGAFMKTLEDSIKLAEAMVAIGESVGRCTVALITDMDTPLGYAIGNSLEIKEVVDVLNGNGPEDLTEICVLLAAEMLFLANKGSLEECKQMVLECIKNKSAIETLAKMVKAQGGNENHIYDINNFENAKFTQEIISESSGFIEKMDTTGIGLSACLLGAGRETEDSVIDFSAGIILHKKTGDIVKKSDVLATIYTSSLEKCEIGKAKFLESIIFSEKEPSKKPIVYARVSKDGAELL